MKKLLFIFTIFALWAPCSWALDSETWNTTIEQTAHFGFVCNNLLQAADERDIETLSEQQKKSVAVIRAHHAAAVQTIIAAQKVENDQVKSDALKSFGNALLAMAQELGVSGGLFGSLPQSLEGSDSAAHLSTIKSAASAIESLCTNMFKKSLQERIARTFSSNYVTTYLVPRSIKLAAYPLSIYLTWQLAKRFQASYASVGLALAPIPVGHLLAKILTSLQEERFLYNQDREFDQQALKDAEAQISVIQPNSFTAEQTNNSAVASAPIVKNTVEFLQNPSLWWKQKQLGPQAIIIHGAHTANAATTIAHHAHAPLIALSYLDISSNARIKALMNKINEHALAHPNSSLVIGIEDIDCIQPNSNGLSNIAKILNANPYLNILIVGTAQNINTIPAQLKQYTMVAV